MRKLLLIALFSCLAAASCDKSEPKTPATAEAPSWTASVAELESTSDGLIEVQTAEGADFEPWRGGQPIPAGAVVRTPADVRATLSLPGDGRLTMNHSTQAHLRTKSEIVLREGQAVLAYPAGGSSDVTVELPTGNVVLHGTKVALFASEKLSSVTVTQGLVEVQHGGQSFEARAGQELLLPKEGSPVLTESSDLGQRVGWSEIGPADAALPAVPRGLGKLVGKTPGGETEHRLDLRAHNVDVTIRGNLAYTEIHETFENPTGQTLEGVYRFPLPADARISRLALKVGNKWMEGEFLETARAERIWKDVIEQWRDPAMLKWKEGNTFELRIFPIDPRTKREVKIGYVQRLQPSSGGYNYTYPMPVDREATIPADSFSFEARLHEHDPTLPLEVAGYPADIENTATKDDKAITTVRWDKKDFVASGDLAIRFGTNESGGLRTYTYLDKKNEDPYAVFVLRPDLPAASEVQPRDFVFVVDQSISQTGVALDLQRRLLPRLIREMDPLDRLTVVACSERCQPVGSPEFAHPSAAVADNVTEALQKLQARGATYPVESVRVAAELLRRREGGKREAHVVYFTDGIASAGELRPGPAGDAVRRTLQPFDARLSVVDFGGNTDDLMLKALATAGRGRSMTVDPMASMTAQALEILSGHYRSILTNPTIQGPRGVRIEGEFPNAIAAGDELVFAARFDEGASGSLTLTGQMNGQETKLEYPVKLSAQRSGNTFVPGEWAARRIEALELAPEDHRSEIIQLSTRYGVLSRHTTLLALESQQMMDEFGVRARDRRQWDGEASAELAEDSADEMKSAFAEAEPMPVEEAPMRPPSKRSTASKPKKKMARPMNKSAPSSAAPAGDVNDGVFDALEMPDTQLGGFGSGRVATRRSRRHRPYRTYRTTAVSEAVPTTDWERKNAERKERDLQSDPDNRTKRMRLIRALIRANQISEAKRQTDDWLQTNPLDPEAIVQRAQLQARVGDLDSFYETLLGAADAAPRGEWLLKRIGEAAKAQGDEALACAYDVSLEATAKRPPEDPADILACPVATHVSAWFGAPEPNRVPSSGGEKLNGALHVTLESTSGDWDIALIEPSGRLLWWGSARQRLKFSGVVGSNQTEQLALPSLRQGTYSVVAIPRDASAGDVLSVVVKTRSGTKRFRHEATAAVPLEVAEVTYNVRRGY